MLSFAAHVGVGFGFLGALSALGLAGASLAFQATAALAVRNGGGTLFALPVGSGHSHGSRLMPGPSKIPGLATCAVGVTDAIMSVGVTKPIVAQETGCDMQGMTIFKNVADALRAGYQIESPYADSEGFLHARIHTAGGWAKALVRV